MNVNSHNQNKYDDYYLAEDTKWRQICSKDKANTIIRLCDDNNIVNLLEIGAGDGAILYQLDNNNFASNYTALEISKSGINKIKEKYISKLQNIDTFDGYDTPYKNNQFDLVIMSHVIEHVPYPRKLINEAMRIGKHLYFEVPCEDNIRLKYNYTPDRTGHINFYSPKTFRRLLQTCDLHIEKEYLYNPSLESYKYLHGIKGIVPYLIKQSLIKLSERFASRLFTYNYSVLCNEM